MDTSREYIIQKYIRGDCFHKRDGGLAKLLFKLERWQVIILHHFAGI